MVLLLFFKKITLAIENPLNVPNNKFGIHILDENDLEDAKNLVNSKGDWGYVTLVIRSDEKDKMRWQNVFDKMRRLHLIPIVRIATRQIGTVWEKPNFQEIDNWVSFLNNLNWVVENRYVIIGNEPNHAKEWGGEVNPEEYADYLLLFAKKLKKESQDFFILNAAFDASAKNSSETLDEVEFLERMKKKQAEIFEILDGWNSHSYPNPDFSGSPEASGRGTVKTFLWEMEILKKIGLKKELPIFITETGWAQNIIGEKSKNNLKFKKPTPTYQDELEISQNYKTAFEKAWNDERIVAITPFIINYQHPPFDIFSWKKKDGSFYNFYHEIKNLAKIYGKPIQKVSVDIRFVLFPPIIPSEGKFKGIVFVKNNGQSIWTGGERIISTYRGLKTEIEPKIFFHEVEPGMQTFAILSLIR